MTEDKVYVEIEKEKVEIRLGEAVKTQPTIRSL